MSSRVDVAVAGGQRGQRLVVAGGDVARPLRFGDLGVVQLGGVVVDAVIGRPRPAERLHRQRLHDLRCRAAGGDPVAADGVEADGRRRPVPASTSAAAPPMHVLEDGQVVSQVPFELHAELGQRTTGHHRHPAEDARGHEAGRHHQGGDGCGAEVLHVGARCLPEPGRLGHRLGHVAAAALVAVADGLLAAAEDVLDRVRVDARGRRGDASSARQAVALRGQVLQHHGGGRGLRRRRGPGASRRRRRRGSPRGPRPGRRVPPPRRRRRRGRGRSRSRSNHLASGWRARAARAASAASGAERQEIEVVHRRQQAEELGLRA